MEWTSYVRKLQEDISERRKRASEERRHMDNVKALAAIVAGAKVLSGSNSTSGDNTSEGRLFAGFYGCKANDHNGDIASRILLSSYDTEVPHGKSRPFGDKTV